MNASKRNISESSAVDDLYTDYSGDLKSRLICILNGQKDVGFQMGSKIWKAQQFEIRINGRHFFNKHLKSGQKFLYFERSWF